MAKRIINCSDATMEVLVATAMGDRIIRIEPGQQNKATVTPKALKPASDSDLLMGCNEWIEILTDTAVVYEWGSIIPFISKASLHCVPFIPAGTGPYSSGYQVLETEVIAKEYTGPSLVEDAPAADAADGEFDMPEWFFGKYVRTKVDNTTYITVRLNLRRLDVSEAQLKSIKPIWKKEIEKVWNSGPKSSSEQMFRFEVDWTDRIPHSSVFVWDKSERPSMFTWSLDMGTGTLVTAVAAHEYGHHLGLSDGYHYQGEIPHLAEVMTNRMAIYKGKIIVPTFETYFWYSFGLNPVTSDRAAIRIRNGPLPHEPNLMVGSSRVGPRRNSTHRRKCYGKDEMRDGVSAVTLIDVELIDAIEQQKLQPLFLDEVDFLKRQSYFDPDNPDPKCKKDGYFSARKK